MENKNNGPIHIFLNVNLTGDDKNANEGDNKIQFLSVQWQSVETTMDGTDMGGKDEVVWYRGWGLCGTTLGHINCTCLLTKALSKCALIALNRCIIYVPIKEFLEIYQNFSKNVEKNVMSKILHCSIIYTNLYSAIYISKKV